MYNVALQLDSESMKLHIVKAKDLRSIASIHEKVMVGPDKPAIHGQLFQAC